MQSPSLADRLPSLGRSRRALQGYKKHILKTANDQIPQVIVKGSYYKHLMVV